MNDVENADKISGKQLLLEVEELLKNLGEYLLQVGKTVCDKIKVVIAEKDKEKSESGKDTDRV